MLRWGSSGEKAKLWVLYGQRHQGDRDSLDSLASASLWLLDPHSLLLSRGILSCNILGEMTLPQIQTYPSYWTWVHWGRLWARRSSSCPIASKCLLGSCHTKKTFSFSLASDQHGLPALYTDPEFISAIKLKKRHFLSLLGSHVSLAVFWHVNSHLRRKQSLSPF